MYIYTIVNLSYNKIANLQLATVSSKVGFMTDSQLCNIQSVAVCRFEKNVWKVFI